MTDPLGLLIVVRIVWNVTKRGAMQKRQTSESNLNSNETPMASRTDLPRRQVGPEPHLH